MPTLVSPATSIRSATGLLGSFAPAQTSRKSRIILSLPYRKSTMKGSLFRRPFTAGFRPRPSAPAALLRRGAQDDRELVELVVAEHEELHALADGVLSDEIGEALRRLD